MVVEADGEGVVTGTSPLTITAIEARFEVEDDEDDEEDEDDEDDED